MRKAVRKCLSVMLTACLLTGVPLDSQAESHTDKGGITYQMEFRAEGTWWNKYNREGRAILDEMSANNGPDDVLNEFNWTTLSDRAAFGEHWIREQNRVEFDDVLRALRSTRDEMDVRAGHIQELRFNISKEPDVAKARWDSLLAGDSIQEHLEKALGIKISGLAGSKILLWVGEKVSSKVASGLATGAGKLIGPISTIASLYQFFQAYDEYVEMELMLDQLLERAEMIAYLDVLLKLYDQRLQAQETIIDELEEAYTAQSKSACREG